MSAYQTFFDGVALGFFLGFLTFYLINRFRIFRPRKSQTEIDRLVDDFQRYYRHVSEGNREDFD